MSAVIYETINLYNKENSVLPYRYIGSDQHNNPAYLGSSKKLREDIKKLGVSNFSKNIICKFEENISNTLLRKFESELQRFLNVAVDPTYYNKTNSSHKGYTETEEEKKIRMEKTLKKRKLWWNSLTEEQKQVQVGKSKNAIVAYNKSTKGKTYEDIFGKEKAKLKKDKHSGGNNGNAKKILHNTSNQVFNSTTEAMKFFNIKYYRSLHTRIKKGEFTFLEN